VHRAGKGVKQRLVAPCRQEIGQGRPCTGNRRNSRGNAAPALVFSVHVNKMKGGASQTCSIGHKHESHYLYGVALTNLAPLFSGSGSSGSDWHLWRQLVPQAEQ
jgi:hypothetical protein